MVTDEWELEIVEALASGREILSCFVGLEKGRDSGWRTFIVSNYIAATLNGIYIAEVVSSIGDINVNELPRPADPYALFAPVVVDRNVGRFRPGREIVCLCDAPSSRTEFFSCVRQLLCNRQMLPLTRKSLNAKSEHDYDFVTKFARLRKPALKKSDMELLRQEKEDFLSTPKNRRNKQNSVRAFKTVNAKKFYFKIQNFNIKKLKFTIP